MNDSPPLPSSLLKAYAAIAKGLLWLLLVLWLVLALAWGAIHGFIVPRIADLRPDLEIEASRVLGVPVRIGSISARTEGLVPSFELADVELLDPQGRQALRLARVVVALSPRSLWNLGFDQLYIEQPQLDIRRAADGRIFVAGLDLSRGSDNGRAADWFFGQKEVVVRGGTLRWTDELRQAPTLSLSQLDFVMRNSARRHAMRLDATPLPQWGERFSLRGQFRQPLLSAHPGRWQEWQGQLHADFSRIDLSQMGRHMPAGVRVQVQGGRGALRAWADIDKGVVTGGTADLSLQDVDATVGPGLAPLALASVSGRLGGKRLQGGFELGAENLQFQTREGERWPGGNLALVWTDARDGLPVQGQLRADRIDLGALSQVASRLPLGTPTHAALTAYAPRGLVEGLEARWRGPLDQLQGYEASGRAVQLAIAAAAPAVAGGKARPGLRGASIEFSFNQDGGRSRLRIDNGAIEAPGVFEEPLIGLDQAAGELQWRHARGQWSVTVSGLRFANADTQGELQASWRTGDTAARRFPGVLDLQASLSRADGTRVWRYLPLGVSRDARDYVRESVVQGTVSDASFRVKGDLNDFPFGAGRPGEFRVTAKVANTSFAFVPPRAGRGPAQWPMLTQLSGDLLFDRNSMQVRGATGRFSGAPGLQVRADAQIADLRASTVMVQATVRGPLGESLAVVNGSPLGAMIGQALAGATASGPAVLGLRLALPVADIEKSQVQGSVTFSGNDLRITPDSPQLSRARGVVQFSERGFALSGVQARALGGDVSIEGASRSVSAAAAASGAEPTVVLRAQGVATDEGLRQARELGLLSRLARDFSGAASYSLQLSIRRGLPEVMLASNLQGMALNLPPPMSKVADAALPMRYENLLLRDGAGVPGRLADQLTLDVGRASVSYVRDLSGAEPRVLRGAIAVGLGAGETAPLPEQGVAANINFANLSVDAWEAALAAAAAPGSAPLRGGEGSTAAQAYLPTMLAVRAKELTVEGRKLHNVVVGGSRDGLTWRANVDADELNGYVEYRQPSGAGAGRVHARLARLALGANVAGEVETLLEEQPGAIPALDVVVEDFELRGKKLGRLEIDAVNRGAGTVAREGGVREWRLNKLSLAMPEAVFSATGNWAAVNAQAAAAAGARPGQRPGTERRRTVMNFRLDIADSGLLLARFGMKDVVRRGRGRMEGQVAWVGSPLTLDYPSMNGAFNVNVESGQFLKADPGLAKLLGVLSLQSLPRRLTLDFRDVFSEGFAFDFVRGDVTIAQGMAATNNLQMKGVNAAVLMEGTADIARETQDLKVVVVPEINAGTASLVASVINPAIGLGTFLAQMFLREPLARAATQEFHIDGTWADPRVTRVNRRAADAPGRPGAAAGAGN